MKTKTLIHIGTSGWCYQHWKGPFYPENTNEKNFLKYYAAQLDTVEINNSFYNLPDRKTLTNWRLSVPDNFIFAVKASRYITHMKKLKDPQKSLSIFLKRIDALKDKSGPVLFQLPPKWKSNTKRLESFLDELPQRYRYVFEFRDPSWFNEQTYSLLKKHGAAFCIYELAGMLSPKLATADFVYIRLHGPKGPYQGQYKQKTLADWAKLFSDWTSRKKQIYCYFDNDQAGYAPQDALRLQKIVTRKTDSYAG